MTTHDALEAFVRFVAYVRIPLHREAYRLCGDWHEAHDLAQVTLIKVYKRWDRLNQQDELSAYARQTLLHTFLSERRRLRWTYEVSRADLPDRACAAPAVDDRIVLTEAINKLAPRQRTVVALRFWADLTVQQTAAVLGCSGGTVTSHTHRALMALREHMDRPRAGDRQHP